MTTDRFKDGIQWWMDTTRPMSEALFPNPPQWHIDTGNLVRLVPQRPWVGLADKDIEGCLHHVDDEAVIGLSDFARAVEQLLKEKNA